MKTSSASQTMRLLVLAMALISLVWLFSTGRTAAQEAEDGVDRSTWTDSMIGQEADTEPAANTPALSAIPCENGMADIYPCENINLFSVLSHLDMGGTGGNDIWGWTDPEDGDEYALVGQTDGTAFVDITDPENPVFLGRLPSHTGTSTWRDIKTYANHAFIVSDGNGSHGMQVFDLTELRNVPNPPVTFNETTWYGNIGSAHNIAINEDTGYAYVVGSGQCSGGLHMVDISDPLNPTFAGCFSGDGYTHDVQCVIYNGPDNAYVGNEICFAANEDTLTIVDVTDKGNPVQLSRTGYVGASYAHQGWITEDHAYFLLGDELDESNLGHNTRTYLWDISDLDNAVNFANYTGSLPSIDHNLYVLGDLAFESNYSSGLRVLDVSDIASGNVTEAAYFDTYPANDNTNFSGQWSNYPYFPSGVVIANDRANGLFVLQVGPDFLMEVEDELLAVCGDDMVSTTLNLSAGFGYTGTVTLSEMGLPAGATADFTPNPVNVPGSSVLDVTTSGVSGGTYPFTVNGTDGTLSHDVEMTLSVTDAVPDAPTLMDPADGASNVSTLPTFTWSAAAQGLTYAIEVALDPAFTNVVMSAGNLTETSYTAPNPLPLGATLYWRVWSSNACGDGAYSEVFSFSTGVCVQPALAIPDNNPAGALSEVTLTSPLAITDLDVSIEVEHGWVSHLIFTLEHVDTGTIVTFLDRPGYPDSFVGCSGDDISAIIDDEAALPIEDECAPAVPTIDGTFIGGDPANNSLMASFDGESLGGTWRLTAADVVGGVSGTLVEWCVLATTEEPVTTQYQYLPIVLKQP